MIQFKPYRIYIVHSEHSQLRAESEIMELNRTKDYEKEKLANKTALTKTDDPLWKEEIEKYEKGVCRMLERIHATAIGKLFFKILNPKTDIWIVPHTAKAFKKCYCAQTFPLNYETKPFEGYTIGHGDSYVYFNPNKDFQDDTLFHELIHAYRYSYNKFERFSLANDEYNTEEFLAMMMQNIYLSLSGKLQLYYTYHDGSVNGHPSVWGTKSEIYDHFLDNAEFIMVLKHFLTHEYLAMLVANSLNADFNPFRDYSALETKLLKNINQRAKKPGEYLKELRKYPY